MEVLHSHAIDGKVHTWSFGLLQSPSDQYSALSHQYCVLRINASPNSYTLTHLHIPSRNAHLGLSILPWVQHLIRKLIHWGMRILEISTAGKESAGRVC